MSRRRGPETLPLPFMLDPPARPAAPPPETAPPPSPPQQEAEPPPAPPSQDVAPPVVLPAEEAAPPAGIAPSDTPPPAAPPPPVTAAPSPPAAAGPPPPVTTAPSPPATAALPPPVTAASSPPVAAAPPPPATAAPPLPDEAARQRIRHDLDTTLIVEAAAGTGKTTELVARLMALVRRGTPLSSIVAVTFTEKAAGEMKLRFRAEVERVREQSGTTVEERQHLDRALEQLETAHIGTIHSFCAELLRERPVEARVDPLFEVAAQDEQDRLYEEAFERWFQNELRAPQEGVRRVLRRRSRDREASAPQHALRHAGLVLIDQRDFITPWRRDPLDRVMLLDGIVAQLTALGALAERGQREDDYLRRNLQEIARFVYELERREAVSGARDHDGLEAELRGLARKKSWGWKGPGRLYGPDLPRSEVLARRDAVKAELDRALELVEADLAACLWQELRPLVRAYEELKARAGKLDFLDLLLLTRDLVRDQAAVRQELQRRFSHLLVDEFQDTDPLQAEILLLLAADDPAESCDRRVRPVPGKLFLVGDPKQSIYRFRRADVAFYEATKRRLLATGAELVHLSTSFRAAPSLQRAINAAFAPLMRGGEDGSQAEYVALAPHRGEPEGRPTLVALPVPRPYGDYGKVVKWKIDESLPDAVGGFVDFLLRDSGWKVSERGQPQPVPIEARHVCLLFKRFQNFGDDVTRLYVRALEVRRIPHVLIGGRSYHAREEVLAVRNALHAIEWPDDELSVFATLRGPILALGDDALLAFRHRFGTLHPLARYDEAALTELLKPVAESLALLGRLHVGRNRRPIADTIARLLDATRAHAGIAVWPTGEQALANLLRVMDLARRFEAAGATSFRAFVNRLDDDAARGGAAEAPVVEEGTDGVRMMTVHRAKGLEFPVVILVDPTAPMTLREPSRAVDADRGLWLTPLAGCSPIELVERREEVLARDRDEAVRLAYVAATRARELLVVPVVGDEDVSGWLEVLNPVVHPETVHRREALPAPGCPAFGDDSVLERPAGCERGPYDAVRPGLHSPRAGEHTVVWWDPHGLRLDREHDVGLRQQRILEADQSGMAAAESERAHAEWQSRRAMALEQGARPELRIHTVTEIATGHAPAPAALAASALSKDPERAQAADRGVALLATASERQGRPRGKRFGTLVHAVLAAVSLDADEGAVLRAARTQARLVGAIEEEARAAAQAVGAALRHPVLARARQAERCHREAPVLLQQQEGTVIEGVIDLCFREIADGVARWTVVDFKTDAELGERRADYELQVSLYVEAVSRASGEAADGVLLLV
ncbi:MAG TPA: UvrD-helicase domain-containing protein [Polyangia bacterium]|nr:UvrD-helicase domain-containing protein [Polyangia bacterium]